MYGLGDTYRLGDTYTRVNDYGPYNDYVTYPTYTRARSYSPDTRLGDVIVYPTTYTRTYSPDTRRLGGYATHSRDIHDSGTQTKGFSREIAQEEDFRCRRLRLEDQIQNERVYSDRVRMLEIENEQRFLDNWARMRLLDQQDSNFRYFYDRMKHADLEKQQQGSGPGRNGMVGNNNDIVVGKVVSRPETAEKSPCGSQKPGSKKSTDRKGCS